MESNTNKSITYGSGGVNVFILMARVLAPDVLLLAGGILGRFLGEVESLPAADAVLVSLARLLDGHEHEIDQKSYLHEDVEAVEPVNAVIERGGEDGEVLLEANFFQLVQPGCEPENAEECCRPGADPFGHDPAASEKAQVGTHAKENSTCEAGDDCRTHHIIIQVVDAPIECQQFIRTGRVVIEIQHEPDADNRSHPETGRDDVCKIENNAYSVILMYWHVISPAPKLLFFRG